MQALTTDNVVTMPKFVELNELSAPVFSLVDNTSGLSSEPASSVFQFSSSASDNEENKSDKQNDHLHIGSTPVVLSPTSTVIAPVLSQLSEDYNLPATRTRIKKTLSYTINAHSIQYERSNPWIKYITDPLFCARILTLMLLLLLLTLCILYCAAQLLSVKLELVKQCVPKTQEEIWEHSYHNSLIDGEVVMNVESQYGHTDEACWTTNAFDAETDQLWFGNKYKSESGSSIDAVFVLFVFMAIYCFLIIVYSVATFIFDIYYIKHKALHTKSFKYRKYLQQQTQSGAPKIEGTFAKTFHDIYNIYAKYMATDTTGYIIRGIMNEMLELTLQTQALMLYNGYNAFDEHSVYLAHKPNYIIVFASILSVNAFGAAILWLSYAWAHEQCHGLLFRVSILFIDQFCDLFYAIFPLITVFTDEYNVNSGNLTVLLGQAHMESGLAFLSACFPLFLLCTKSLFVIRSAVHEMRDIYYKEWKFIHDVLQQADDKEVASNALKTGSAIDTETLSSNDKTLYDINGKLLPILNRRTSKKSWIDRNKLQSDNKQCKQILLSTIALLYTVFGIIVLYLVQKHVQQATTYCNLVREQNYIHSNGSLMQNIALSQQELSALYMNPELFFWDKCLYKIYPFASEETQRCQCRVLVIDWSNLDSTGNQRMNMFNLTQNKILIGMLEHWVMLEKFFTKGAESSFHELKFIFTKQMFKSQHMKAFEWNSAAIDSFESGISSWKKLEYLKFENTAHGLAELPSDFDGLSEMKYLSFISSGISSLPTSICSLKQLIVLQLEWESNIIALPHCIDQLSRLEVLLVDGSLALDDIPLSIFNLPNLMVLSFFKGSISFDSLLAYNLPLDIEMNDTILVDEWMNDNFQYNPHTKYYLSLNPICDEDIDRFPSKIAEFINTTNACQYLCNITETTDMFCHPMTVGDGRCNEGCNIASCKYDAGDCMQLCFAPGISNCSLDKLNNDVCDYGCNNKYCAGYEWQSIFETPMLSSRGDPEVTYASDSYTCVYNGSVEESLGGLDVNENACTESVGTSIFTDIPTDYYGHCRYDWIGDGECDDSCRTEACLYDLDDCSKGCVDDECSLFYQIWLFFVDLETYKVSHGFVCSDIIPIAVQIFEIEDPGEECPDTIAQYDYNQDQYLNFREFVAMAYIMAGSNSKKGTQVNCSECVGMQYYNV